MLYNFKINLMNILKLNLLKNNLNQCINTKQLPKKC